MQATKEASKPGFTHFFCVPLIRQQTRNSLGGLQNDIVKIFSQKGLNNYIKANNTNLFHLTINMLDLAPEGHKKKIVAAIQAHKTEFQELMKDVKFTADRIQYFSNVNKNQKNITYLFLNIKKDENYQKFKNLNDKLMKICIKEGIVRKDQLKGMRVEYDAEKDFYQNQTHITLFSCEGLKQDEAFKECFAKIENLYSGHSLPCDSVDISTRLKYDETKFNLPQYRIHFVKKA